MTRERLERNQSWIYLTSILAGLAVGLAWPSLATALERALWPLLACLLYATFTQVPLTDLRGGFRDWRYLAAMLTGNFLAIPLFVGALAHALPLAPPVQLGVLLVLLVPCTDWFISFTHLGRGDTGRAIAATPFLLVIQLLALPVYLWLFFGPTLFELAVGGHLLAPFTGLILLPLLLAGFTERLAVDHHRVQRLVHGLARLPVPLLALVVFAVAASQVPLVAGLMGVLPKVLLAFVAFLLFSALLGPLLARVFRLELRAARTLTFSLGTRNSFVLLPIALGLPEPWRAAVVVIVFQTLVELFGMVAYISWVPRRLLPDR
ncbi:arsenic resistance protein [Arhodomonas sp. SL1]|uniref:arsenic resistance protein n=1 Tax=Arhodomonas sp. SL1 TaxID=3425691 RepID=UPI003F88449D